MTDTNTETSALTGGFMTTDDLAALLGVSTSTVRWLRHVGRGPRSIKPGKRVLYSRSDVESWIKDMQHEDDLRRGLTA